MMIKSDDTVTWYATAEKLPERPGQKLLGVFCEFGEELTQEMVENSIPMKFVNNEFLDLELGFMYHTPPTYWKYDGLDVYCRTFEYLIPRCILTQNWVIGYYKVPGSNKYENHIIRYDLALVA